MRLFATMAVEPGGRRIRLAHDRPFGSHTMAFVEAGKRVAFASVHGNCLDTSVAMAVAYALQPGG